MKEEEERAPGEKGIRSCARDKAERDVDDKDRRRSDAWSRQRLSVAVWAAQGEQGVTVTDFDRFLDSI